MCAGTWGGSCGRREAGPITAAEAPQCHAWAVGKQASLSCRALVSASSEDAVHFHSWRCVHGLGRGEGSCLPRAPAAEDIPGRGMHAAGPRGLLPATLAPAASSWALLLWKEELFFNKM